MTIQSMARCVAVMATVLCLSACKEAPKVEVESSGFSFKDDASILRTTDGIIRIDFAGKINEQALVIELNDNNIEQEGSLTPFRYSVGVDQVGAMLNNGLNSLYIEDVVSGLSENFTFFLDVVDPRLIIDSVRVSDIELPFPSQNIISRVASAT
jgi:hypothetical protein